MKGSSSSPDEDAMAEGFQLNGGARANKKVCVAILRHLFLFVFVQMYQTPRYSLRFSLFGALSKTAVF